MTIHDNSDPDAQHATDDDATDATTSTDDGPSVPLQPRHGPQPTRLT